MSPVRALTVEILCDPVIDDEIPARDIAASVLGSLEQSRWEGDLGEAMRDELRTGALGVDPRAALMGGARGDDGEVLRAGCGS